MAFPAAPLDTSATPLALHFLTNDGNSACGWFGVTEGATGTGANTVGFAAIATHVEGDAVEAPGALNTTGTDVPVVLVAGDDGTNAVPLQLSGSDLKITLDSETVQLATGANAIGKLAANSGVDIGDVDVTSIVPGAGATNLGKAEDAAHASSDVGVMALAVRDDNLAAFSGAEGDYEPLHTDSSGRLHVVDQNSAAILSDTTAILSDTTAILSDTTAILADTASMDANLATIDADTGNMATLLGTIDTDTGAILSDTTAILADTASMDANLATIDADTGAIKTAVETIDDTVYIDDADWNDGTSKHLLVGGLYQSAPQTITDGDVGPLEVDTNGYLKVSLVANPIGVGGGVAYTEDAPSADPQVGTAIMMERDDALGGVAPIEGDWIGLRGSAEGALWTQDFNSDALLADTTAILSDTTGILADTANMDTNITAILADTANLDTNIAAILADTANIDTNITAILADTANIDTNVGTVASDTTAILADTANMDTNITSMLADTANMDTNLIAVLADTAAMDANLVTIDVDTGAIKTAVELIDDAVVAEGGALSKFMVIAGDDGADVHPLQTDANGYLKVDIAAEDAAVTVDGAVEDNGPSWTMDGATEQHYATIADGAVTNLWTGGGGNYIYITDILVSVSGTAVDVTFGFGAAALDDVVWIFYGDIKGGVSHTFRTPLRSDAAAHNFYVDPSAAATVSVLVLGYVKTS